MAYVHLPDSPMAGGIAKIIGKLQGKISAGALKQTSDIANKLRVSGCPAPDQLNRLKKKSDSLNTSLAQIDRRLDKFRRIPKKLKAPVSALKVIIKVIKALPIPQSVPPGFGLPINLTVKYSDLLVKLQEFVQQIDEIIVAIETALEVPSSSLGGIKSILSRTDSACAACQVSSQLQQDLENGNLTQEQLAEAGLLEDDGTTIFSNLGPLFLGNSTMGDDGALSDPKKLATAEDIAAGKTDPNSKNYDSSLLVAGTGSGTDGRFTEADLNSPSGDINRAIKRLSEGFDKLQDSNIDSSVKDNIRKLLSSLGGLTRTSPVSAWRVGVEYKVGDIVSQDSLNWKCNSDHISTASGAAGPPNIGQYWDRFFGVVPGGTGTGGAGTGTDGTGTDGSGADGAGERYTAANGTTYLLEIRNDPTSPSIAPRRFGVALTLDERVAVLKGQPSFSSDTNVLLDEVKFRLDNQLP